MQNAPTFLTWDILSGVNMPKISQNLNGSDDLRLRYFAPKFQKISRATLISGCVNRQHDNDWNRVYR